MESLMLPVFSLAVVLVAYIWSFRTRPIVQVLPTQPAFLHQGRWLWRDGRPGQTDWPCTAVTFDVEASDSASFELLWRTGPGRFNLTVGHSSTAIFSHFWQQLVTQVEIPHAGRFTVVLRKLSGAHPLGTGVMGVLPSRWEFQGLDKVPSSLQLLRPRRRERRIEFVASGDALGFSIHDSTEQSFLRSWLRQVKVQNCQAAYPGLLADLLDAEYRVEALLGVGVVQNAYHHVAQHLCGQKTWLHYWPRLLASEAAGLGAHLQAPHLVLVHLGLDDFNQQGGAVPTNNTFRVVYTKLLHEIINTYGGFDHQLSILAMCGGRDVADLCADACEWVEDAVGFFHKTLDLYADRPAVRVDYLFLPCRDTGDSSQKALGHLEPFRHQQLAAMMATKIRSFMAWE